jgi:beta-glucosidase
MCFIRSSTLFILLSINILSICGQQNKISIAQKVDSVMALMTVDEKIGQINQLSGRGAVTGPFLPEDNYYIDNVKAGKVGSMLNVVGAETTRKVQKIAVEQTRMKIPLLFGFDVIHGYKTIFPMPLGEASSWNPDLAEKTSRMAAVEASATGIHWTFAPMVDICRDPRWGRIFEGHGEDPFLGSAFARSKVKGFQGDDLSKSNTIAACVKHFAAYGAAIGGRDYNGVDLSERVLMETYFPPYKAAIDAGAVTVMASFNDINGIPATANEWLFQKILRKDWGFKGMVVSDYMGITEMKNHRIAKDTTDAAYLAFRAGVDMDMMGRAYIKKMKSLIDNGKISIEQLDFSVRAILTVKFQLGLFDDPYRYCNEEREKKVMLCPEHRELAREAARQSLVLLKNEKNFLPLNKNLKNIAVIGPLADNQGDLLSSWSFKGDKKDVVTLLTGVKSKVSGKTKVLYSKGCDFESDDRKGFQEAIELASKADVVIMALGESRNMSGEGYSKADIGIPGLQQELLNEINKLGKPVVLVLFNGRPLTLSWENKNCSTILEAWLPGTEGGNAVADVLFGDFNPSGKLTVSFPYSVGQIPIYYAYKSTGRPAKPNQRYTSKYSDIQIDPLYEFGYGLSYSKFEYSVPKLSSNKINLSEETTPLSSRRGVGGEVVISVDVTNTSTIDGTEIVQLYIEDMISSVTLPVRELKGFDKRFIAAGKTETFQFSIKVEDLKFYDKDMNFIAEPGTFKVFVGGSSKTTNFAEFELE